VPKGEFVGEFELYVMLAVARLGDAAYGISIRQAIEARTGREIAIGAVYATLGRLEDKDLVRHWMSEPRPIQGGRTKKHYALTPSGQRALKHSTSMLSRMMAGVPGVAGKARA